MRAAPGCGTIAIRESDRPADAASHERYGDASIVPIAGAGRALRHERTRKREPSQTIPFAWKHTPKPHPAGTKVAATVPHYPSRASASPKSGRPALGCAE